MATTCEPASIAVEIRVPKTLPRVHVEAGLRSLRVLVVDDERDATHGLVSLIRSWGHAARRAYDGPTACEIAGLQHPDVVLLDLETPHLDWRAVVRQLRLGLSTDERFVIAFVNRADEELRRQYSRAGIDLVLVKPVDPSMVEAILLLECIRANRSQFTRGAAVSRTAPALFHRSDTGTSSC